MSFFTAKLPEKVKKIEILPNTEDLETFDAETETGITDSREAIDDLIRARRCDLWGRQCDQLLLSGDQIFTPGHLPGAQDR